MYKKRDGKYDNKHKELFGNLNKKISEVKKQYCEGFLTFDECGKALRAMKKDKSPGSDGFTVEFFKMFWGHLGWLVVRSLNESYEKGELSITQKRGILTCLPKPDKDRRYLKNWRPITLLNVIYKVGSKVMVERSKACIEDIILEK